MAAGFNYVTDLYEIYNTTQNVCIRYVKDSFIATLRDYFSKDSRYHYVRDQWGYPFTPDLTNMDSSAGLHDDLTTRIYIGHKNRFDTIFYPAVLVSTGSFRSVPIGFNRDHHMVEYENLQFVDGYGNSTVIRRPVAFTPSGAWEGSVSIDILSRSQRERDDLVELIPLLFLDYNWQNFYRAGISIKPTITINASSETEDRNDKLFKQSINLDVRGEWFRKIPIDNTVDLISLCVDLGNLEVDPPVLDPNIQINANLELLDAFDTT